MRQLMPERHDQVVKSWKGFPPVYFFFLIMFPSDYNIHKQKHVKVSLPVDVMLVDWSGGGGYQRMNGWFDCW